MPTPDKPSDPLFWPLVIFAAVFAVALMAIVVVVWVMSRRSPGHHPQVSGHQGTNTQTTIDKRSTEFVNHGAIHIGTPPKPDDHG